MSPRIESIREITWYDRRYDTAVTNAVGKPQSHSFAHGSAQSSANLEHGDENSRWHGNRGAYDREDELEAKFSFFLPSFLFFFPFGKKSFYIYIYRERNETDQTDEHVGIDGGPMLHYVHFFDPQLLLGPSEVGEQTVHLIVSIQITGHELA